MSCVIQMNINSRKIKIKSVTIVFIFSLFCLLASLCAFPIISLEANSILSENNVVFSKLDKDKVLSDNPVYSIEQDHYGYLWFGGNGYLFKYDSSDVEEISTLDNHVFNNVWSIYMDSYKTLWIGTMNGLFYYDDKSKGFKGLFNEYFDLTTVSDNHIRSIYQDSYQNLWVGTSNGLNLFDRETGIFTGYYFDPDNPDSISNNRIRSICEDRQGILWLGTANGLNSFDRETGVFTSYFFNPDNPDSISNNRIRSVYVDSRGILWLGTENGLNSFDRETGVFTGYFHDPDDPGSISDNYITAIYEDRFGKLWIGTENGFNSFDRETGVFTSYFYDSDNLSSIGNNSILAIYEDEQGILWIGTREGVYFIDPDKQHFNYRYDIPIKNNEIRSIYNFENTLLLGGLNSIMNFACNGRAIEELIDFKSLTGEIDAAIVYCIYMDKRGFLWVGTSQLGLLRIDMETFDYSIYNYEPLNPNSISNGTVRTMYQCPVTDLLWIGTNDGLCNFDYENNIFTRYNHNPDDSTSIIGDIINIIYGTSNNELWLGTNNGLDRYDTENGEFIHYFKEPQSFVEFIGCQVESIYEDSSNNLWIGTIDGLFKYNREEGNFTSYTIREGLSDNHILGIIEDNSGKIWVTTKNTINSISPDSNVINSYRFDHGLRGYINYRNSIAKNEEGAIFIGTTNGIFSFYPDKIEIDTYIPPVYIKDFHLVDGNPVSLDKPIEEVKEVTLAYSDNSFIINFIALDYSSQYNNMYAYKLDGFDSDWQYSGANQRIAKYTNIPGGEYIFRVIASNKDGIWNEEGASLIIIITPPFWQEWWFILFLIAVALLTVAAFIKFRTRSLFRHAQILEMQVSQRTAELDNKTLELQKEIHLLEKTEQKLADEIDNRIKYTRALVHELKTPLNPLVAASDYLVSSIREEPLLSFARSINTSAINLSDKIDILLDIARMEVGILQLEYSSVDIQGLLLEIYKNTKIEAEKNELNLLLEIDPDLPVIQCDEERIKQAILNLLNNAFKYTPRNGTVVIKAKKTQNIIISVIDTGCGIDDDEKKYIFKPYSRLNSERSRLSGLGIGLSLVKQTIELHKGRIWFKSQKGKGSVFSFYIPIKRPDVLDRTQEQ